MKSSDRLGTRQVPCSILFLLCCGCAAPRMPEPARRTFKTAPQRQMTRRPDPAGPGPRIAAAKGLVQLQRPGSRWKKVAGEGERVGVGSRVRTAQNGEVVIDLGPGATVRARRSSALSLLRLRERSAGMGFDEGDFDVWIQKRYRLGYYVVTPSAIGYAKKRPFQFRVEVKDSGRSLWDMFEGGMTILDNLGKRVQLRAGQRLAVDPVYGAEMLEPIPDGLQMPDNPYGVSEAPASGPRASGGAQAPAGSPGSKAAGGRVPDDEVPLDLAPPPLPDTLLEDWEQLFRDSVQQ